MNIPEEFTIEQFDEVAKIAEENYKRIFKTIARRKLERKFKSNEEEKLKGLSNLLEAIDNDKISFKNLKSNYKYFIERDEAYKNFKKEKSQIEENKNNLFSLESTITIEDL